MMKRFWRMCCIVLVLSMLINMLPMNVFATEMQTDDQEILTEDQNVQADDLVADMTDEELLAEDAYILNEVIEERTEYSKTFRLSNGLNMAAVYSEPVHYEKDGQWEEIDNTLQLSNGKSGNVYTNTAGRWFVSFPQRLTENSGVTISMEDYFLSFRMTGELRNTGDAVMDTPGTGDENATAADEPADIGDTGEENSESQEAEIPSDEGNLDAEVEEPTEEITESVSAEEELMMDTTTGEDPLTDAETATNTTESVSSQEDAEVLTVSGSMEESESATDADAAADAEDPLSSQEDTTALTESGNLEETESDTQESAADQMAAIVSDSVVAPMSESDIFVEPSNTDDMRASVEHEEMIVDKLASSLKYENVYTNTDLVYDLISNQVKEYIIMDQYCADLRGYQYILEMDNLQPVLTDDNVIELYDAASNELVMLMPAPFLVDSADEYCYDVGVLLQENNGSYVLSYILPHEWLADESRAWPVTLDPAVQSVADSTNTVDQTVYENAYSAHTESILNCGYEPTCGRMRVYLRFNDLPDLGVADVIVDATITLMINDKNGTGTTVVEAREVTETWDPAAITWTNQPGFDENIVADYISCAGVTQETWNITEIVRSWYETGNNYGLVLKGTDALETSGTNNWIRFRSADNSSSLRPALTITFRNNNGLEDYWDYTASSAGRAGTGYVNNYSGNLVWVRDDIGFGGNRMPVTITHVYNSNDSLTNEFGMGYGWRTNFNQRVYYWDHEDALGEYYVWEDADGTAHYFLYQSASTYVDEDGLQLTLKTNGSGTKTYSITDLYGNASYFDANGRLTSIVNNQATKSSIDITYTTDTGYYIKTITDGVGRKYEFTYYTSNTLSRISYKASGTSELAYIQYAYSSGKLTTVTYQDGMQVKYTYIAKNLLNTCLDVDGYMLTYTYNSTADNVPSRVKTIVETDNGSTGGQLTFTYEQKQTTIADAKGNVLIHQFNNWGNTVSIQDDLGRAQYAQYAINDPADTAAVQATDSTAKGNQLRLSSKLQNSVGNVLDNSSFENSASWTATASTVTCSSWSHANTYAGSKFLRVQNTGTGTQGAASPSFSVAAGETYTFSAYVYSGSATVYLDLYGSSVVASSEQLTGGSAWTRLEVSYTATSNITLKARIMIAGSGTIFADCVQVEEATTASRYNLVQNGDFRFTTFWSASSGREAVSPAIPGAELNIMAYKFTGSPTSTKRLSQTVAVSGSAGDYFVLAGWAIGYSVPLETGDSTAGLRKFGLILTFNNTDGTTTTTEVSFNPYVTNWQYAATGTVAEKAYSSIKIELAYDYNANKAWFDGIQLYREAFGNAYTYYNTGRVKTATDVQGQETTYSYNSAGDLTTVYLPSGEKVTYTYDSYHNVKSATTAEGIKYTYTYDTYGNNLSVSIGSTITSYATYTSDGNRLATTKDAAGKITTYQYNANTNVLEWVQYPKDTDGTNNSVDTRTHYTYDKMYRLEKATAATDTGLALSAGYTYSEDMLTSIATPSTTYNFTYGNFGLRSNVQVGSQSLAKYYYESGTNRLIELEYGNSDVVQYTYNTQGWLTKQTYYENGSTTVDATVTYLYDNDGALASVIDSASGITTKYYYDFAGRLVRYTENNDNDGSTDSDDHAVAYTYDDKSQVTRRKSTALGSTWTMAYVYDEDGRITSATQGTVIRSFTLDAMNRLRNMSLQRDGSTALATAYSYKAFTAMITGITITNAAGETGKFQYAYDDNGNISAVTTTSGGVTKTTQYVYDTAGQLVRENNARDNTTTVWTYDNAGNILSEKVYVYTTGTPSETLDTVTYTYGNSNWGDLLTKYDGYSITYDSIGNPTSYYNGTRWAMTWEHGRQLATMSDTSTSTVWTNTYNSAGLRTSRTDGTTTYTYYYEEGRLSAIKRNDLNMWIIYDENGPVTLKYGTGTFHYVTNLQGDVVAIVGNQGQTLVEYTYDAWGKVLSITGDYAYNLGIHNPILYRGYIYDHETGLYYCQSRYYDPETGRFLNADAFTSTGQGLLGNNMFAYCRNNPVCRIDTTGTADATIFDDGELLSSDDLEARRGGGNQALGNATGTALALAAATLAGDDNDRVYTVYYLYATGGDPTIIVYVGRVKTINFAARMAYHATQGRSLADYTSHLNYAECRAMEQAGMMWHHTINRGNPLNNQIRGVSPTNQNRHNYFEAIMHMIAEGIYPDNALLPLSYWENLAENEWLNID